ncbi:MAG: DUF2269 domain-containing protein [Proteobacteria bacterium]|nr:DUF2269 domain-containing protein [Pseudomonadota bacterium]
MEYFSLKLIHIISSTILFGTGIGSAFYMFMANRQKDVKVIYSTVKNVVIADWLFTTSAIVIQLISGIFLAKDQGYSLEDRWLVLGIILYFFAGFCWLPVVWIQIKMRDMAKMSVTKNATLPKLYWTMELWWITLGVLAFPAIIAVFYLMICKPEF